MSDVAKPGRPKKGNSTSPSISRLQVKMTTDYLKELQAFILITNFASLSEMVRRALSVYILLYQAQKQGKQVLIQNEDGSEKERLIL